ncbi:MAG: hypothetical protein K2F63_03460, partial [Muribaculaceae bacterium]|nr:hypothetical protein [Muribaculaceae bacterium]
TYTAPAGVESDHIIVSAHLGDDSTELEVVVAIKERPMTYELTFGGNTIQKGCQNYTSTWTAQIDEQIWNISNFNNNNNGWDHIRAGRNNNNASVAKIATAFAYSAQITDVVVTITECADEKVNSFTLTTYTDEALTNVVETVNATATAGDVTFTLTAPANNLYYVITLDLQAGTSNGFVRISKVAYLTEHPAQPVPATMYVHYFTEGAWNVSAMDENNTVSVDLNTNDEYFFSTFDGQTPEVVAYAEIENKDAFADHDVYANNYSGKGIGEGFAPYTAEEDGTHKLTLSIAEDGTHSVEKTVTTGVENVIANEAEVEYFNLQGVRVANPENGIFIRRQG